MNQRSSVRTVSLNADARMRSSTATLSLASAEKVVSKDSLAPPARLVSHRSFLSLYYRPRGQTMATLTTRGKRNL